MYQMAASERLSCSIESETTHLSGIDMVASFVRIPSISVFENANSAVDFMPTELLHDSLYDTLSKFPVLVGRLRKGDNGFLSVAVDKYDLNMPEFKEIYCDTHYDELAEANFSTKCLPNWDSTSSAFATGRRVDEIKLASVQIVRLQDNSGVVLFSSVAHALLDAVGYCTFMKTWADTCRKMVVNGSFSDTPAPPIVHDRGVIWSRIPRQLVPSNDLVRHVHMPASMMSRWLAWVSPETRGKLIKKANALIKTTGNCYYISRKRLDALRESILRVMPTKQRMSHNDLMVTLITVAMAQCAIPPRKEKRGAGCCAGLGGLSRLLSKPKAFQTSIATDIRPRLPGLLDVGYCGNGMIKQIVTNSFDELQQPVTLGLLGTVAKRVRHSVDAVTTEFVQQFADGVHSSRDCYLRPIVCGPKHPMKILTTNHTRLGYYENNFGFGAPAWVCPPEGLFPNFIVMLPAPPNKDGYNIFINAPTDILDRVKAHEYWSSMTEFVN